MGRTIYILVVLALFFTFLPAFDGFGWSASGRTSQLPQAVNQAQPSMAHPMPCSTEQIFYDNGRMTGKLICWNNEPLERTLFEYLDELSRYSVQTLVYNGQKLSLMRRDLFQSSRSEDTPDRKLETWYYYFAKDRTNALRQVDTYWPDTSLVKERQLFDESGGLKAAAYFEYDDMGKKPQYDDDDMLPGLNRMALMDDEGRKVLDYREQADVDIELLYRELELTSAEISRRVKISRDTQRIPVLIMDGGIDMRQPELAYKIWRNPHEVLDGRDDDGDGLIDDLYGVSDNPRLHQPVHDLRLPHFGFPDFSHGTLVASIAAQGREDVAIMVASEFTARNSTEIISRTEQFIRTHQVRFTNMSFVFDKQLLGFEGHTERPFQIKDLISHTPETLHVVAAGNGAPLTGKGFNMDKLRKKEDLVPAMLTNHNILVVGALDTANLNRSGYPGYRVAHFSNVGETSVDILAPGTKVCGAQMGGGTICKDGTSFAAPYVLNHGVLAVAVANPDLSIYDIKEIILKSAYIPSLDKPFAVRSGGILYPGRAVATARWLAGHPHCTVEKAVIEVRRSEQDLLPGEGQDEVYVEALHKFWGQRRIGRSEVWQAQAQRRHELVME